MKNLLVAVDGSSASKHAADQAKTLALATGGRVTLVTVIEPFFMTMEMPGTLTAEVYASIDKAAELVIREAKDRLQTPDFPVGTLILRGDPGIAVCEEAERGGYDLLVVGTRGRNAVARVLLGSVASRIVQHSKVPVLVVR